MCTLQVQTNRITHLLYGLKIRPAQLSRKNLKSSWNRIKEWKTMEYYAIKCSENTGALSGLLPSYSCSLLCWSSRIAVSHLRPRQLVSYQKPIKRYRPTKTVQRGQNWNRSKALWRLVRDYAKLATITWKTIYRQFTTTYIQYGVSDHLVLRTSRSILHDKY